MYELIDDFGVFNVRLLAQIDNEENLRTAMARIQEGSLIALAINNTWQGAKPLWRHGDKLRF